MQGGMLQSSQLRITKVWDHTHKVLQPCLYAFHATAQLFTGKQADKACLDMLNVQSVTASSAAV